MKLELNFDNLQPSILILILNKTMEWLNIPTNFAILILIAILLILFIKH